MKRKLLFVAGGIGAYIAGVGAYLSLSGNKKPQPASSATAPGHSGVTSKEKTRSIYDTLAPTYDDKVGFDEAIIGITRLRKALVRQAKGRVLELCAGS
jgi:hypothetical protein